MRQHVGGPGRDSSCQGQSRRRASTTTTTISISSSTGIGSAGWVARVTDGSERDRRERATRDGRVAAASSPRQK